MTSPIFQLADDYVATSMRLHPLYATVLGSTEFDDRMPDLSPVGIAEREAMDRATLDAVHRREPQSDADRRCRDLMIERLTADVSPLVRAMAAWAYRRLAAAEEAARLRARRLGLETDPAVAQVTRNVLTRRS